MIRPRDPDDIDWSSALTECAKSLGPAPRTFSLRERLGYLRVPRPFWARFAHVDGLAILFRNVREVFRTGRVVWGQIVQANEDLYDPGEGNLPGEVVFSLESPDVATPEYFDGVAMRIFELKGTAQTDPERAHLSEYLADELTRVFGLPVPASFGPVPCMLSTTYFVRRHLPQRHLATSTVPLLASQHDPHVVLPVPERFWPAELLERWT